MTQDELRSKQLLTVRQVFDMLWYDNQYHAFELEYLRAIAASLSVGEVHTARRMADFLIEAQQRKTDEVARRNSQPNLFRE